MNRRNPIAGVLGAVLLAVWMPLLIGGLRSLRARGRLGESDVLIASGPYAYVRHPLYAGLSMTLIGLGLVFRVRRLVLGGTAWLAVTHLWSIREEAVLARKFGPAYEDYRRATPAIVPDVRRLLRPRQ